MEDNDRNEKPAALSVSIDGARIRNVRETKRLTQLYVANVVGVTTDTISRWENNRYPSIRRDNAQKLADALDVPLAEILRREQPSPAEEDQPLAPPPSSTAKKLLLPLTAVIALAILATLFIFARRPDFAPVAMRWTPRYAAPGEVIPVQVKVMRQQNEPFGFILKERLAAGMRLVRALPPASASESSPSEVKWLVPKGGAPVTISYTLRTPAPEAGANQAGVRGEIVLHGGDGNRTEPVGGSAEIRIGPYHWADSNGDGSIDDDEIMPAYYIWEEMKGLGLDWKTIEAIWSGKGYSWNAKSGYVVLK